MRPSAIHPGLVSAFQLLDKPAVETIPTGVPEVDAALGGFPRGALTEICGAASSGRTSLLLATLAQATHRLEVCALIDVTDAFDPASATAAGVDLDRLLWVRCGGNVLHALTAADWLIHGGGFGVVPSTWETWPPTRSAAFHSRAGTACAGRWKTPPPL